MNTELDLQINGQHNKGKIMHNFGVKIYLTEKLTNGRKNYLFLCMLRPFLSWRNLFGALEILNLFYFEFKIQFSVYSFKYFKFC